MRAMVLHEYAQPMVLEDRPVPEPVRDQVLVRVRATGVCGSELKVALGRNRRGRLPRVLGHEFAGEVAAVGPEVRQRQVGERGVVYMYIPCGICEQCSSGHENLCVGPRGMFGSDRDGGYCEYVLAPEANLIPIPDTVPMEEAAILGDAVATSWHALKASAGLRAGQTVVITGLGGLGIHAVQLARACGARIIAVDTIQSKLEVARENGAHHAVNATQGSFAKEVMAITGGLGVDAAVDFRGRTDTIEPAIECLKPYGVMVMVGYNESFPTVSISQKQAQGTEVRITGGRGCTRQELVEVVQMAALRQIRPLIVKTMPLEQANEAIRLLGTGEIAGRIVLVS